MRFVKMKINTNWMLEKNHFPFIIVIAFVIFSLFLFRTFQFLFLTVYLQGNKLNFYHV